MDDLALVPYDREVGPDWTRISFTVRVLGDVRCLYVKKSRHGTMPGDAPDLPPPGYYRRGILSIAPGEWLILLSHLAEAECRILAPALEEPYFWTAEIGDGLMIVDLDLDTSEAAKLFGLPASCFEPGRVARTRVADMAATFASLETGGIRTIFDRSRARHMATWLAVAR